MIPSHPYNMTKDPKSGIPESGAKNKNAMDHSAMESEKSELAKISVVNKSAAQSSSVWMALCERAAVEKDPKKLLQLISEINRLLDAREKQLSTGEKPLPEKPSDS